MLVRFTTQARLEFQALPSAEKEAMRNAVGKLEQAGEMLAFPHSTRVRGTANLRELRPRAGRSAWRAFYRRIGDEIVVAAFGPEAQVDPRGFERATRAAEERLEAYKPKA
jgi:hypothetical protein